MVNSISTAPTTTSTPFNMNTSTTPLAVLPFTLGFCHTVWSTTETATIGQHLSQGDLLLNEYAA
ncbi:MAG: hypothetical protein Q9M13_09905 [Mariprofundales bacterium]|nr:hypothetical protein [Mariprofundales bacterium]